MKKLRLLLALIPLLGLSACGFPKEDDLYRNPELFLTQVERNVRKFRGKEVLDKWECYFPENEHIRYEDCGGIIKDQLKRITSFEKMHSIRDKTAKSFTYTRDCIECEVQSMTVYETGYIYINSPHWLSGANSFYFKFDSELASSIYKNVVEAFDYYKVLEEENTRIAKESVEIENFFSGIENKTSYAYLKEEEQGHMVVSKKVDADNELIDMIKNTKYTEEKVIHFYDVPICFICNFNEYDEDDDSNASVSYSFQLSSNYKDLRLGVSFYDEFGRGCSGGKYYSIPATDGEAIYNYALSLPEVPIK